jgi:hypothetical protein
MPPSERDWRYQLCCKLDEESDDSLLVVQNLLELGSSVERRVFKLLSDQVRDETRRDQGKRSRTSLLQQLMLLTDEQMQVCIDSWNAQCQPGELEFLKFVLSKNRYIAKLETRVKQLELQLPMARMKMRIPLDVVHLVDSEEEDGPRLEDLVVKDLERRPDEAGREAYDLDSVSGNADCGNPCAGSESVFCPDCEIITLNGQTQWDDHKIGKRHKTSVKKNRSGQAACCDP